MKNSQIFLALSPLILICFFSCDGDKKRENNSFDEIIENRIISKEQGITMYYEFEEKRNNLIQPLLQDLYNDSTFVDTKFIWFSLKDLKDYLAYVDAIQADNPNQDVSGIRMYFAAYPSDNQFGSKTIENPRQQTIFMIPTVSIGQVNNTYNNLNHLPFIIETPLNNENSFEGEFKVVEELMLDYSKDKRLKEHNVMGRPQKAGINLPFSTLIQTKKINTIFNEGSMSPPPYNDDVE